MPLSLDTLTTQALALPPEQRIELAEKLWFSVEQHGEDEDLFTEIARRAAEIESGAARTYSHQEVIEDAQKVIGE